jgi:hypothetical protein
MERGRNHDLAARVVAAKAAALQSFSSKIGASRVNKPPHSKVAEEKP